MSTFLFLYRGYVTPTPEIGRAWMEWFESVGDRMVDSGNPLSGGAEVTPDGVTELPLGPDSLTGYSVVRAADRDEALALAATNPMVTSVVVHELARM
ncbi:hypothetical protein [Phycicoccus sonneratiae]|uniref:YCII-related domain-containing protein n=1 Tax=Phycicoccus sonneratiae TaxID=2807628 RepID=A0ABS2CII4_9MICO|nr:hypothetical protein [Phycicoccus sonneraticus]MBM6399672.1 hypothetical protein [Phycicoccus sonneraticus]